MVEIFIKIKEKIKAVRFLIKAIEIKSRDKGDSNKIIDIVLNFNGSRICFTGEGDICINAKRHIITTRKLSLDNCDSKFTEEALTYFDKGEEEFNAFLNRESLGVEVQERIKEARGLL